MTPLLCQNDDDHPPPPPPFRHPLTPGKPGSFDKSTAAKNARDPIEVDSRDDSNSSSDGSDSDIEHRASSATAPTSAISTDSRSSVEDRMENTMIGGGGAGGPSIDHFADSHLGFEDGAAEDKCQKKGNVKGKLGRNGAEDGQAEDRPQEMGHNIDGDEDGPGAGDRQEYGHEDIIENLRMEGIEDDDRSHDKDGYRVGVSGNAEGEQNSSEVQPLQTVVYSSPRVAPARSW